jgi:hypothetical protein
MQGSGLGEEWRLLRARRWLADRPALDPMAGGRFGATVEDLGVQIDFAGPLDRPSFRVDGYLLEHLASLIDRGKDSAGCEQRAQIDFFDYAVLEEPAITPPPPISIFAESPPSRAWTCRGGWSPLERPLSPHLEVWEDR